ncbi:MAG: DNA-binding protein [Paludibacteraceae bacterium]|nr:DNA-binding protein [Paludibacteraceae bacterium]MBP5458044.1 DNA-binding protein [Paludibacteraceae bacterium]MBR4839838.1 DNA-binding protein [Paludibacteraceae bacterium]
MKITFNELRQIKDSLPDGSIHRIAESLNLTDETVRNYFGGHNFKEGMSCGIHVEAGPEGGIIEIDNPAILNMAIDILKEYHSDVE